MIESLYRKGETGLDRFLIGVYLICPIGAVVPLLFVPITMHWFCGIVCGLGIVFWSMHKQAEGTWQCVYLALAVACMILALPLGDSRPRSGSVTLLLLLLILAVRDLKPSAAHARSPMALQLPASASKWPRYPFTLKPTELFSNDHLS